MLDVAALGDVGSRWRFNDAGGVATGAVRQERDGLRSSELHVVLETTASDVFANVRGRSGTP